MAKRVKEALDDVLCKTLHNTQSGVRYAVYTVVEQVMLDLLRKDVIGGKSDTHSAKFFDMDQAIKRFSKRLGTSTSFIAPIATLVRR